jgi:putative nucleotidyltransferase with HDIG domain
MMYDSLSHPPSYLKDIRAYIARMPSLSTTAAKVLETCNNPQSSPNDLNRVISLDPVLAAQVLRLTNSAYYSLSHPVSSLTRAIIMLGINTVKNLVLSFAILEQLRKAKSFRALSAQKFWAHSLSVGVIAKCLAMARGVSLSDQEEFFVCGLLHDLGKIPLNCQFPDEYSQMLDLAKRSHWPLAHAESVVFGIDHSVIGGLIAKKWRLSRPFIEALEWHHQPDKSLPEHQQLVLIVALADIYSQLLDIGSCKAAPDGTAFAEYLLERVGVDWPTLYDMRDTVLAEIEKAKIYLEISE